MKSENKACKSFFPVFFPKKLADWPNTCNINGVDKNIILT